MTRLGTASWIGIAFCTTLAAAACILAVFGAGERGIFAALLATARLAFLPFWLAYAGSALVCLFGAVFQPLKRHGRELGLAFAAALAVHLGLVAWLCLLGKPPSWQTFVIFGIAAAWTMLLVLFSFMHLPRMVYAKLWWVLRIVGMNYIAGAFAFDFLRHPRQDGIGHIVEYLPFAVLALAGPCLRFAAFSRRAGSPARARHPLGNPQL